MLDDQTLLDLGEFFKMFGDATRLKILMLLREGEYNVSEIADKLQMSHSSISHQLGTFRQQRVVKFRREGKAINYALDDEHVEQLLDLAVDHLCHR